MSEGVCVWGGYAYEEVVCEEVEWVGVGACRGGYAM